MINKNIGAFIAVISHKRPHNVKKIMEVIGEACTFFVNDGEIETYRQAGAHAVCADSTNICKSRNLALGYAFAQNAPCIQVSDDLKKIKLVFMKETKRCVQSATFEETCATMMQELKRTGFCFGGVAINSNPLNYTGEDFSHNKLIVNDLICMLPSKYRFDENVALKEDYDMSITQLLEVGGLVRCNQFLCDFPHRENEGGANTYRNSKSEDEATAKLYSKWGNLIKKHPTRPGQIALNYKAIQERRAGQQELF